MKERESYGKENFNGFTIIEHNRNKTFNYNLPRFPI